LDAGGLLKVLMLKMKSKRGGGICRRFGNLQGGDNSLLNWRRISELRASLVKVRVLLLQHVRLVVLIGDTLSFESITWCY
jgi:hypothetical protein